MYNDRGKTKQFGDKSKQPKLGRASRVLTRAKSNPLPQNLSISNFDTKVRSILYEIMNVTRSGDGRLPLFSKTSVKIDVPSYLRKGETTYADPFPTQSLYEKLPVGISVSTLFNGTYIPQFGAQFLSLDKAINLSGYTFSGTYKPTNYTNGLNDAYTEISSWLFNNAYRLQINSLKFDDTQEDTKALLAASWDLNPLTTYLLQYQSYVLQTMSQLKYINELISNLTYLKDKFYWVSDTIEYLRTQTLGNSMFIDAFNVISTAMTNEFIDPMFEQLIDDQLSITDGSYSKPLIQSRIGIDIFPTYDTTFKTPQPIDKTKAISYLYTTFSGKSEDTKLSVNLASAAAKMAVPKVDDIISATSTKFVDDFVTSVIKAAPLIIQEFRDKFSIAKAALQFLAMSNSGITWYLNKKLIQLNSVKLTRNIYNEELIRIHATADRGIALTKQAGTLGNIIALSVPRTYYKHSNINMITGFKDNLWLLPYQDKEDADTNDFVSGLVWCSTKLKFASGLVLDDTAAKLTYAMSTLTNYMLLADDPNNVLVITMTTLSQWADVIGIKDKASDPLPQTLYVNENIIAKSVAYATSPGYTYYRLAQANSILPNIEILSK